jgi:hypothetical protein
MKTPYESNAWTLEERLQLYFRSQRESARVRDGGVMAAGPDYPASSLMEGRRPLCFASGAVYSCCDRACPYRAACEGAVSPWLP